ncbi:MAG TPA: alpha/beta fold hydrolase [Spirochaetota bacterium]|nr:alpha/beta fold hydrolase [Spirochaetota bacterium]
MELSGMLLRMTGAALDAIIKSTNASIRTHGENNIPQKPVVYVINHFTRMETFFLPYVIHQKTGKVVLSLAFHEFFGGGFGKFLNKLGAISTKEPDRNRIMIGSLLTNEMSCLIYPEGQMIKDKKIIEKGKYMIFNTGIRRPPHTGAGILALRSQFYREKIKYFQETGYDKGINAYREYFNLSDQTIGSIVDNDTCIVPVNITYFPIRAKNNLINRLAKKFFDKMPERLDEELEVEGTMIIDGVDIDINFGKPIEISPYLQNKKIRNKIRNQDLYIPDDVMNTELVFRKEALKLMYRYMDAIYDMTTVNHDHVFSYILSRYNKKIILENDFKNRAFLAIDRIRDTTIRSHHTNLKHRQGYLLTDDEHGRYESFITAAISDGLILRKKGYLIKNTERFSRPYEFHNIRRDNIVEVLKNEIEPMKHLLTSFNRVMLMPEFFVRRAIRKRFLKLDNEIFERDYKKYYKKDESKPETIGRPQLLKRFWPSKNGILLIHGYMAAPEEVRALGNYLFDNGYTVYLVRLRGHGTSPEDLSERHWEDWYESVNRGYIVLKNSVKNIAVAGFSTGAGLALYSGIIKPDKVTCVVSISAPLHLKNIASRFTSSVVLWNHFLEKIHVKRGKFEFVENNPENAHINYFKNPINGVNELEKFMDRLEGQLKDFSLPVILIQGSKDPVVNPESAIDIFRKMGPIKKELCMLYSDRHGIINHEGSATVFKRVKNFLDENINGDEG